MADDWSLGECISQTREAELRVFGVDHSTLKGPERAEYVRLMVLAGIVELTELLNEFEWKPWKNGDGEARSTFWATDELVDVLHFVFNLASLLELDGERLTAAYRHKMDVNASRMEETE